MLYGVDRILFVCEVAGMAKDKTKEEISAETSEEYFARYDEWESECIKKLGMDKFNQLVNLRGYVDAALSYASKFKDSVSEWRSNDFIYFNAPSIQKKRIRNEGKDSEVIDYLYIVKAN